jgi:hypothetical protein
VRGCVYASQLDLVGGLIKRQDWGGGLREAMTKMVENVLEAGEDV